MPVIDENTFGVRNLQVIGRFIDDTRRIVTAILGNGIGEASARVYISIENIHKRVAYLSKIHDVIVL